MTLRSLLNWKTILLLTVLGMSSAFACQVHKRFAATAQHSHQSRVMMARSTTFAKAVEPGAWPPGYPLLLLAAQKAQIPLRVVNPFLLCLTLLLLTVLFVKHLPGKSPVWPLSLYTVCAFNYRNLALFTSEALVIPMSISVLLLLLAYSTRKSLLTLLLLSVSCSVIFISRYHGVLWLLPLVVAHIVARNSESAKATGLHLLGFCLVALGPISVVMLRNYLAKGYLSGKPRFGYESRHLPQYARYFAEKTGFVDNLSLTVKTYFVDFLSPCKFATHQVNHLPYSMSWLEACILLLVALCVFVVVRVTIRHHKHRTCPSVVVALRRQFRDPSPSLLLLEFLLGYVLVTVLAWTFTNNDPIYTRFMYPSYVYFIALMCVGCSSVKRKTLSLAGEVPFLALFVAVAVVNLHKIAHGLGLVGCSF